MPYLRLVAFVLGQEKITVANFIICILWFTVFWLIAFIFNSSVIFLVAIIGLAVFFILAMVGLLISILWDL